MFEKVDSFNGNFNKYFISNLYYDKDKNKYKVTFQLGKGNCIVIYFSNSDDLRSFLIDLINASERFFDTIELLNELYCSQQGKDI